jgi:hypothetical protein
VTRTEALTVMVKAGAAKGHYMVTLEQLASDVVTTGCLRCNATWASTAKHDGSHLDSTAEFFTDPRVDGSCPNTGRTVP